MHFSSAIVLSVLTSVEAAFTPAKQQPVAPVNNQHETSYDFRIPTIRESAIMARRIMHLEGSGTLSTIFPSSDSLTTLEDRPEAVAHQPFALPEYIADCEPSTGTPTILQVDIANTFKNIRAGGNVTLSVGWTPPGKLESYYSAAMMPRFALTGWLQEMELSKKQEKKITSCWMKKHPDTVWTPGSDIHASRWVRFMPEAFYWFGGFGDRARIQWISVDEWRSVTLKEVEKMRLPGEEGGSPTWPEWSHPPEEL